MVRVLRSSEVRSVACIAIRWSSSKACGVALGAGGCGMNTDEREVCGCVVKACIQPVIRVVAHGAVNRILLGFVIFCSIILYLMTSNAIGWRIEYRSLVARGALGNSRVSAGQLKTSRCMIKGRWLPTGWGVASLALNR